MWLAGCDLGCSIVVMRTRRKASEKPQQSYTCADPGLPLLFTITLTGCMTEGDGWFRQAQSGSIPSGESVTAFIKRRLATSRSAVAAYLR